MKQWSRNKCGILGFCGLWHLSHLYVCFVFACLPCQFGEVKKKHTQIIIHERERERKKNTVASRLRDSECPVRLLLSQFFFFLSFHYYYRHRCPSLFVCQRSGTLKNINTWQLDQWWWNNIYRKLTQVITVIFQYYGFSFANSCYIEFVLSPLRCCFIQPNGNFMFLQRGTFVWPMSVVCWRHFYIFHFRYHFTVRVQMRVTCKCQTGTKRVDNAHGNTDITQYGCREINKLRLCFKRSHGSVRYKYEDCNFVDFASILKLKTKLNMSWQYILVYIIAWMKSFHELDWWQTAQNQHTLHIYISVRSVYPFVANEALSCSTLRKITTPFVVSIWNELCIMKLFAPAATKKWLAIDDVNKKRNI